MNKRAAFTLVLIAFVVGGGILLFRESGSSPKNSQDTPTATSETTQKIEGYEGNLLAGTTSPYLEFTQMDYEKAQKEGKVIFINFYANWCPTCRVEFEELKKGFVELQSVQVVGFQVNWNDTETDEAEKALAREFEVTYQHTKVIIKDGQTVYGPVIESWTSDQLVEEISKHIE